MKIIITESQLQSLNELQWLEKVHDHINNFRIPITSKIYQTLYGTIKVSVFHISDVYNIDNMKNLIGRKKTLSAFKFMEKDLIVKTHGIQTKGGIIYQITGNLVLYAPSDIMSRPDENGIRWIDPWEILPSEVDEQWTKIARDMLGIYGLKTIEKERKTQIIKEYFKAAEKIVSENRESILKNMLRSFHSMREWDEILVSNIQIRDIFWDANKLWILFNDIQRKVEYNHVASEREKNILKSFPEWANKIQKKLESITTGKVYGGKREFKKGDMTPIQFIEERGGHISEKTYQIPSEISSTLNPYIPAFPKF